MAQRAGGGRLSGGPPVTGDRNDVRRRTEAGREPAGAGVIVALRRRQQQARERVDRLAGVGRSGHQVEGDADGLQ